MRTGRGCLLFTRQFALLFYSQAGRLRHRVFMASPSMNYHPAVHKW